MNKYTYDYMHSFTSALYRMITCRRNILLIIGKIDLNM